jgi:CRP/FNR family transcriptional regulator
MQNVSSLDAEENGRVTEPELSQLLIGCEDIRLTSIHPRGAIVFAQGELARGVYLLRAGRVKVSLSSAEGRTIILRVAQAGALLGVNMALKGGRHEVWVETLERSRIDFIARRDFLTAVDKSDAMRASLLRFVADESSDLVECVRSLLLPQSAAEKLARLLIRWSDAHPTSEARLNLGLTHEEIAQMIGASRETVTRLFAAFRKKQIVSCSNNTIVVSDRNALESMAGISTAV